ncbi:ParB/RepB/Spo0J family partition protein [Streptomyces sp. H27-C3]|uniref:ParB/RepB/Spo0J family partition protein n=1 Tax=Streptomyces sp. H27-C3 TaxID=3046305 RepID=UPI0024BBE47A|nr:ParB/RepB/Spo0J family partition protein [Streptomyces sp. H27-C3]MDJ0465980.1 ParB/RepB/Spo0J family partition protein [Streptomyces sp. H27-C3]
MTTRRKKDTVPRYQSEERDPDEPTRNDLLAHYGLGSGEESDDEREMREWEEAQARRIAAGEVPTPMGMRRPAPTVGPPTELPLAEVCHNPDNPRDDLGDVTRLGASMKRRGQLQPAAVMTRAAYLAAKPDQQAKLPAAAQYVVIDGNRRLAAATEAGLAVLKVVVNDQLGTSPEEVLESALVANALRKEHEPLETAQALRDLIAFYGSQERVAEVLDVTQVWVSQRLSLLKLTPELQRDLEDGKRMVSHLRGVGHLPAEEQRAAADAKRSEAQQTAEAKRLARKAPRGAPPEASKPGLHNAVPEPSASAVQNGVLKMSSSPSGETIPDRVSWSDAHAVHRLIQRRMAPDAQALLGRLLTESEMPRVPSPSAGGTPGPTQPFEQDDHIAPAASADADAGLGIKGVGMT